MGLNYTDKLQFDYPQVLPVDYKVSNVTCSAGIAIML